MARIAVIIRQNQRPTCARVHALSTQHGGIKVGFHPSRPGPPDVEVTVAPCLEDQEHDDEDANEHQRQRRGLGAGERGRNRNAQGDNGPVGRVVKTRPPDRAAVDLATIEMS